MRWHMIRKTFPTNENFVGLDIHLSDFCLICWVLEVCENFDKKVFLCIIIRFCMKCEWNFMCIVCFAPKSIYHLICFLSINSNANSLVISKCILYSNCGYALLKKYI